MRNFTGLSLSNLSSKLAIIFFLSLSVSCKPFWIKPDVSLYGQRLKDTEKFSFVDLSKYKSFDSLLDGVDSIACKDSIPVIELINKDRYKYIRLITFCRSENRSPHFKARNSLSFVDEQIMGISFQDQDNLNFILEQFIFNPDNRADYSDSPKRALIFISYLDKGIEGLPKLLDRLTDAADHLGASEYLNISLRKAIPPPPPPPPGTYKL